jgi:hypothetical protein
MQNKKMTIQGRCKPSPPQKKKRKKKICAYTQHKFLQEHDSVVKHVAWKTHKDENMPETPDLTKKAKLDGSGSQTPPYRHKKHTFKESLAENAIKTEKQT